MHKEQLAVCRAQNSFHYYKIIKIKKEGREGRRKGGNKEGREGGRKGKKRGREEAEGRRRREGGLKRRQGAGPLTSRCAPAHARAQAKDLQVDHT